MNQHLKDTLLFIRDVAILVGIILGLIFLCLYVLPFINLKAGQ